MQELSPGLLYWQTAHPEWEPGESWPQLVSSYAWEQGPQLTLFDPIGVPDALLDRIPERETVIVLTDPWHERDAEALATRFDLPVHAPTPDTEDDLMRKFGVTRDQAAGGSPDLAWLVARPDLARWYAPGDDLGRGIRALPGSERNDLMVWVEEPGALVVGDTVVDFGDGLEVWSESITQGRSLHEVLALVRPVLELPIRFVLPTHGAPTTRAALERALG